MAANQPDLRAMKAIWWGNDSHIYRNILVRLKKGHATSDTIAGSMLLVDHQGTKVDSLQRFSWESSQF